MLREAKAKYEVEHDQFYEIQAREQKKRKRQAKEHKRALEDLLDNYRGNVALLQEQEDATETADLEEEKNMEVKCKAALANQEGAVEMAEMGVTGRERFFLEQQRRNLKDLLPAWYGDRHMEDLRCVEDEWMVPGVRWRFPRDYEVWHVQLLRAAR
jgi:hypothetical protein